MQGDFMVRGLLLSAIFALGVVVAPAVHAAPASKVVVTAPETVTGPIPINTGGCYWANCTEAHQNGEGNIPQGSAHYCAKQDRDGDGVACEW
jgi:hypothetical protein